MPHPRPSPPSLRIGLQLPIVFSFSRFPLLQSLALNFRFHKQKFKIRLCLSRHHFRLLSRYLAKSRNFPVKNISAIGVSPRRPALSCSHQENEPTPPPFGSRSAETATTSAKSASLRRLRSKMRKAQKSNSTGNRETIADGFLTDIWICE